LGNRASFQPPSRRFAPAMADGSADWMLTIGDQYYGACCPCLLGKDMCEHVGGNGLLGCFGSLLCPGVFTCVVAPKIAAKSGIDESLGGSAMKGCFLPCCFSYQVGLEYYKQKQMLKAGKSEEQMKSANNWMVKLSAFPYMACCPCMLGGDMCKFYGSGYAVGCVGSICCSPCFLCMVGPVTAGRSKINHPFVNAVLLTLCPCTQPCYAQQVVAEYQRQKFEADKPPVQTMA